MAKHRFGEHSLTVWQKIWHINWIFVLIVCLTASVGFGMLYSAAGGNLDPWASRQMARFGAGFVLMLIMLFSNCGDIAQCHP